MTAAGRPRLTLRERAQRERDRILRKPGSHFPRPGVDAFAFAPWACFTCRKCWKQPFNGAHRCPECRRPLHDMGDSFKPPRQADRRQWAKVRTLWNRGFRFSRFSTLKARLPTDLPEILAQGEAHPAHTHHWLTGDRRPTAKTRAEARGAGPAKRRKAARARRKAQPD